MYSISSKLEKVMEEINFNFKFNFNFNFKTNAFPPFYSPVILLFEVSREI
jgi:hypothetical protein